MIVLNFLSHQLNKKFVLQSIFFQKHSVKNRRDKMGNKKKTPKTSLKLYCSSENKSLKKKQ